MEERDLKKEARRKARLKAKVKRNLFGWALMIVPLALFAFFVFAPMIRNFILSFQDNYFEQNFVGLDNFKAIFSDPSFLKALGNIFRYIL